MKKIKLIRVEGNNKGLHFISEEECARHFGMYSTQTVKDCLNGKIKDWDGYHFEMVTLTIDSGKILSE
jgi:hypothetical protein